MNNKIVLSTYISTIEPKKNKYMNMQNGNRIIDTQDGLIAAR